MALASLLDILLTEELVFTFDVLFLPLVTVSKYKTLIFTNFYPPAPKQSLIKTRAVPLQHKN